MAGRTSFGLQTGRVFQSKEYHFEQTFSTYGCNAVNQELLGTVAINFDVYSARIF